MCWHHFCTHLCCGLECLRGIVTCPVQCSVTDNGGAGRPSNWVWCLAWSCSLSSCAPCVTSCLFCIATISASIWPSSWTGCAGCGSNIVNGVLAPLVTPVRTQDTQCACDGFYSQLRARFFFFLIPSAFQLSPPVPPSSTSQSHWKRESVIVELLPAALPASLALPLWARCTTTSSAAASQTIPPPHAVSPSSQNDCSCEMSQNGGVPAEFSSERKGWLIADSIQDFLNSYHTLRLFHTSCCCLQKLNKNAAFYLWPLNLNFLAAGLHLFYALRVGILLKIRMLISFMHLSPPFQKHGHMCMHHMWSNQCRTFGFMWYLNPNVFSSFPAYSFPLTARWYIGINSRHSTPVKHVINWRLNWDFMC